MIPDRCESSEAGICYSCALWELNVIYMQRPKKPSQGRERQRSEDNLVEKLFICDVPTSPGWVMA